MRHSSELASAYLERPGFLRVYFGDSSEWSDTGFRDIIEVFRDRIGSGMCYFENGKSRWPTPSQVAPVVDLPPPLGRRRVYLHMISELEPFARERSQGVAAYFGNVSARTLATLTLAACLPERLKLLAVPWLRSAFRRDHQSGSKTGFQVVRVDDLAAPRQLTVVVLERRHYWITGIVPAVVADMLADGMPVVRGSQFLSEAVDAKLMMQLLEKQGVVPQLTVEAI